MPIDPRMAALLAFSGGLASGGGPARVPVGLGQAMGGAAQGGLAAYMQAQGLADRERQDELRMIEQALRLSAMGREQREAQQRGQAQQQLMAGLSGRERLLAQLAPQEFVKGQFQQAGPPEPPVVRDFYEGGQVVQKQWDPEAGDWLEVGRGARWQPQQPRAAGAEPLVEVYDPNSPTGVSYLPRSQAAGRPAGQPPGAAGGEGTTLMQNATYLARIKGISEAEAADSLLKTAAARSADPEKFRRDLAAKFALQGFEPDPEAGVEKADRMIALLEGRITPQEFEAQGGDPGWIDAATGWLKQGAQAAARGVGLAASALQGEDRPAEPAAQGGQGGQGVVRLQRGQQLTAADVQRGQTYEFPDGTRARWNGQAFEVVE